MKKSEDRSLSRSVAIYGIGNIGTLVINFFLVPLYTFYLSTDELGYFDIVAATLIVIVPFAFGHIELAIIRWIIADKDPSNIKSVVSNSFVVFISGLLIFTLAYFVTSLLISWDLVFFVFLYLVSNLFYIVAKQVIRAVYSSMHYVGTEVVYTLIVFLFVIFYIGDLKLEAVFLAYTLASFVLLIYMLFLKIYNSIDFKVIEAKKIKELLSYSSPLIPNTFSLWLNNTSNKYLILFLIGLGANGIYAIAYKFAYVVQILNKIFYFSFQDKMYSIYGKPGFESYFSDTFNKYTSMLFTVLYVIIVTQKIVLPWIIDDAFLEAMDYIPLLGSGVLFMSLGSIVGIIYQCAKRNLNASKTSFVSALIIVGLGLALIPYFGLYGASWAFTIGNLCLFLYRYLDIRKIAPISVSFGRIIVLVIIGIIFWAISLTDNIWLQLTNCILVGILGFLLNREFLENKMKSILQNFGQGSEKKD